ncbi:MAG: radical SAM protein [Desulfovibrionales bacterium]|nr:radical SAM protein [Desulfovibrionales bacterium]
MKPKWPAITWASSSAARTDAPRILGINPWIHDFAAYNLWSRPAGLLAMLHMLRASGAHIALMDCLDQTWSDIPWPKAHTTGKGHYPKKEIPKPAAIAHVPRRLSRYGHDPERVRKALTELRPRPDLVLITTIMTYWYPGAAEALDLVRSIWPHTPVAVGGIYATLCPEHAATLGADLLLSGPGENLSAWSALWKLLGCDPPPLPAQAGFGLAQDLYNQPGFSILLGSRGCPFHCAYCASNALYPGFAQSTAQNMLTALKNEYDQGVRDFVFYDDALLIKPGTWLWPVLEWLENKSVRLHTPNAMHVRYLTPEVCARLKRAGLHTVRLGLETVDFTQRLDSKLSRQEWEHGLARLFEAGFCAEQIGAYILFGLPNQDLASVAQTIDLARASGIRPDLAYYTPIPGSPLFAEACAASDLPLAQEPLCQNNSLWPCVPGGFSWDQARLWQERIQGSAH